MNTVRYYFYSCLITAVASMQAQFSLHLDPQLEQKLKSGTVTMVSLGHNLKESSCNGAYAIFKELAQDLERSSLDTLLKSKQYNEITKVIDQLYQHLLQNPEYQQALKHTQQEHTQAAWNTYIKVGARCLSLYLQAVSPLQFPELHAHVVDKQARHLLFLEKNTHLNIHDDGPYLKAGILMLYYLEQVRLDATAER